MRTMLMLVVLSGLATPLMAQRDTLLGYRVWLQQERTVERDRGVKGLVVRAATPCCSAPKGTIPWCRSGRGPEPGSWYPRDTSRCSRGDG